MNTNQVCRPLKIARLCATVALVTIFSTVAASAQDLPSGEEVMARHIKMTGGQAAYDKIKNRVSEASLEIVGAGVSLDVKTYSARPNKILIQIDSKITGKIAKGCTGEDYWENSLTQGPVVHEGQQKAMGLRESTFERFVYWKKIYESAECVGLKKVGETDCYEVVLTPRKMDETDKSKPTSVFLDNKDYLMRKITTVVESEAGSIPVVAYPEDYKQVDGIMMAHKIRMEMMGQNRLVIVNKVEQNVELPTNQFDPPEDVKKLIK